MDPLIVDNSPAKGGFVPTPSDTVVQAFKGLYCSVAGNVTITGWDSQTVTFAMVAGSYIPIAGKYVNAATTATLLALA